MEMKKKFRSFKDARKFARGLSLKSLKQWKDYCKSGKKPEDIPSNPNREYFKEWDGFPDFLGYEYTPTRWIEFLDFQMARTKVHKLKLESNFAWRDYCKSGLKPQNIPAKPERTYKNKGWSGYGDWLGTGTLQTQQRKYLNYENAKLQIKLLELKSHKEWKEAIKNKKVPKNIPSAPDLYYKKNGWKSWGEFIGTGRKSEQQRAQEFLSYGDAKKIVQKLAKQYQIKTANDWRNAIKKGLIPENIPKNPWHSYSKMRIK